MKYIGIIPNTLYDIDLVFTKKVLYWLVAHFCEPLLLEGEYLDGDLQDIARPEEEFYQKCELLLVLGGDGTLLHTARKAALHDIPILGINLGHLGYLTDVDKTEAFHSLERTLKGEYKLEKRMMLQAVIQSKNKPDQLYYALNEACVSKADMSKLITSELYINQEYIDTYRSDGVIVCTPTGSTAYNLSAGGPILKPDSHMIAITPICPHTLYARPFVISSDDIVEIQGLGNDGHTMMLTMDGENVAPLYDYERLTVRRSQYYATIVKTNQLGFYDILRRKMVGVRK